MNTINFFIIAIIFVREYDFIGISINFDLPITLSTQVGSDKSDKSCFHRRLDIYSMPESLPDYIRVSNHARIMGECRIRYVWIHGLFCPRGNDDHCKPDTS